MRYQYWVNVTTVIRKHKHKLTVFIVIIAIRVVSHIIFSLISSSSWWGSMSWVLQEHRVIYLPALIRTNNNNASSSSVYCFLFVEAANRLHGTSQWLKMYLQLMRKKQRGGRSQDHKKAVKGAADTSRRLPSTKTNPRSVQCLRLYERLSQLWCMMPFLRCLWYYLWYHVHQARGGCTRLKVTFATQVPQTYPLTLYYKN